MVAKSHARKRISRAIPRLISFRLVVALVQIDKFWVVVLTGLVVWIEMHALSLSLKSNVAFYIVFVLELPLATESSLKLFAIPLHCI